MPDQLLQRLRRLREHTFPGIQEQFQNLVKDGQHPTLLVIGCFDSRLVPYLLTGTGPENFWCAMSARSCRRTTAMSQTPKTLQRRPLKGAHPA